MGRGLSSRRIHTYIYDIRPVQKAKSLPATAAMATTATATAAAAILPTRRTLENPRETICHLEITSRSTSHRQYTGILHRQP